MDPNAPVRYRIAVLGDVGGHADRFRAALADLGVDLQAGPDGRNVHMPDDLIVIQAGDLIHKGPASDECLLEAERLLDAYPGRYIQLLGNHEMHYIKGAPSFWPDEVEPYLADIIRSWWNDRTAHLAVAIDSEEHGQLLISHAGLTVAMWRTLRRPADAAAAAAAINALQPDQPHLAAAPGVMLGPPRPTRRLQVELAPSTTWAEPVREILLPWHDHVERGGQMPFGLIHGHATPVWWRDKKTNIPQWVAPLIVDADRATRRVHSRVGGRDIFAIDPGFSKTAPRPLTPLVVHGQLLNAPGS